MRGRRLRPNLLSGFDNAKIDEAFFQDAAIRIQSSNVPTPAKLDFEDVDGSNRRFIG